MKISIQKKRKTTSSFEVVPSDETPKQQEMPSESSSEEEEEQQTSDEESSVEPEVESSDEEEQQEETNGFAGAMSLVLSQNIADSKTPILAKRTTQLMRTIAESKSQHKVKKVTAEERRRQKEKNVVLPNYTTLAKDRQLRKIATKGVVALFNAITKHQQSANLQVESKLKKQQQVEVKAMSKANFLNLLKDNTEKASTSDWKVLDDKFMMGAKLKHWDQSEDEMDDEMDHMEEESSSDDEESDPKRLKL